MRSESSCTFDNIRRALRGGALACVCGVLLAAQSAHADGVIHNVFIPPDFINHEDDKLAGFEVDMAGDLAVITAPLWMEGSGAVFVHRRDDGGTTNDLSDDVLVHELTIGPGGLPLRAAPWSVATDGTSVCVVGGAWATVYEQVGEAWQPVFEYAGSFHSTVNRTAAMSNGILVVAPSLFTADRTKVLTFERGGGGNWSPGPTLDIGYPVISVDFDGTRLVAQGDSAVTVYVRSGQTWTVERVIPVANGDIDQNSAIRWGGVRVDGNVIAAPGLGGSPAVPGVHILERDPTLGWQGSSQFIPEAWMPDVAGDRVVLLAMAPSSVGNGFIATTFAFHHYHRGDFSWELKEVVPKSEFGLNEDGEDPDPSSLTLDGQRVLLGVGLNFFGGARTFAVPFYGTTTSTADAGQRIPLTDSVTGEQNIDITFDAISGGGETTFRSSEQAPALPSGFQLEGTFYDIETTASVSGAITICIDYSNFEGVNEADLRLLHYENDAWRDITVYPIDTVNDIICGVTTSLSPFAIVDASTAPDPLLMIADLIDAVADLNLAHGIDNSLDTKLDRAVDALIDKSEHNDHAAINSMESFINAVLAQVGNQIPASDAAELILDAEDIIDILQINIG